LNIFSFLFHIANVNNLQPKTTMNINVGEEAGLLLIAWQVLTPSSPRQSSLLQMPQAARAH
jgi:hypothetical protein